MKTALLVLFCLAVPFSAFGADKLIVKDSGGTTKFVVTDAGYIGVNTTTPTSLLEMQADGGLNTDIRMKVASSAGGVPVYYGMRAGGSLSAPSATPTGKGLFWLGAMGHGSSGWSSLLTGLIGFWTTENWSDAAMGTEMRIYTTTNGTNARAERLRITHDGKIGIGTTSPTHLLQLSGGAFSDGTTWEQGSSRELKENIQTLSTEQALEALKELTPVTYNYKSSNEDSNVGFIAEDVPELVASKGRKSLNAMDIVAVLTKVMQEQSKTIDAMQEKIDRLESLINNR